MINETEQLQNGIDLSPPDILRLLSPVVFGLVAALITIILNKVFKINIIASFAITAIIMVFIIGGIGIAIIIAGS
jgi:hypothetical protein